MASHDGFGIHFDFDTLAGVLRRDRKVFLTFVGAVLLAAILMTVLATPKYQAVALIQLMPRAGREVRTDEVVKNDEVGYLEARDRARTQIQIILSRSVREEVVKRYRTLGHTDLDEVEGADALKAALSAGPREDTQLVEIRVLHPDPVRAAVLANLVAEVYSQANLDSRTDAAREAQVWIERQTGEYRAALDKASAAAMAFKEAHDLVDIEEKVDDITTRMAALQKALGDTTTERVLVETRLGEHERLLSARKYAVLAGMFDDPALQTMSREYATIATEAAEVLARYGNQHPEHQRAMEHIKRVESTIAGEVRRNVDGERSQLQTLQRQEAEIAVELDKVKAELLERQRLSGDYAELKLDEDRARRLYGSLGERGAEVDFQAQSRLNDVRIVDPAVPPKRPATPNLPLNLAMAILLGGGGGLAIVLARRRLEDRIVTGADVLAYLDTPLLGTVPSLPENVPAEERPLYVFNHSGSLHAESLRSVRAMLHASVTAGECRRIVVTSSIAEEGKTQFSIGLATTLAQLGLRVLLIDADLRCPKLHTIFGVADAPGLSDAMVDAEEPSRFVVRTLVPRLHLLPRGAQVEFPSELLCAPELERVLTRLAMGYQVVIIDTPPAGLVSDALAMARRADNVILVLRQDRVPRKLALKVLSEIRIVGGKILGIVLNDVPRAPGDVRYGSHYYHDRPRTAAK